MNQQTQKGKHKLIARVVAALALTALFSASSFAPARKSQHLAKIDESTAEVIAKQTWELITKALPPNKKERPLLSAPTGEQEPQPASPSAEESTTLLGHVKSLESGLSQLGFSYVKARLETCDEMPRKSTPSTPSVFLDCSISENWGAKEPLFLQQRITMNNEGEFVSRIEQVQVPKGKGLGKAIVQANIKWLRSVSNNPNNRLELDATTSSQGLVGAYAWAKLGLKFKSQQTKKETQEFFLMYLKQLFPRVDEKRLSQWIRKQALNDPNQLASLDCGELIKMSGSNEIRLFSDFSVSNTLKRYRSKKHSGRLGKAFLLDPAIKASWAGQMLV